MEQADVIIVGGGMVGGALAAALAKGGLSVAVIDRERPADQTLPQYDGRASAIAHGSKQALAGVGLWDGPDGLAPHASPIWDIRVADGHILDGVSPLFLHYDHREIGADPFGYIVENRRTRITLGAAMARDDRIALYAPYAATDLKTEAGYTELTAAHTESGEALTLRAPLCLAADGKFSTLRDWAGIKLTGWAYDQTSLVCTVRHEEPHHGVAVELFLRGGPFAMLPMTENRSNVVWSERSDLARGYADLADGAFLAELQTRFGDWLGEIELVGPRFSYPLSLQHAETYIGDRLALVGDAGHAIHPIAGQGLNMGLRDVAALAEVLVDAKRLGLDIGAPTVLRHYEQWRRFDNILLAGVTDGLTRLFSNDIPPLRLARDLGLAAVDRMPPVKKLLMRHAMGVVGDLPRLIRGEAL
ncbi:MAG: UbiH/UbiF/VisC/COQ6 family ubiquinone biosynthesis hydroxylase [Alphaproteobacteria bacterium]|nr:UbiH/UbiF/VisC/COQ6 family ubiquinone biosynthesis hydroxylase [Alphaproteobacteria bacterium]